MASSGLTKVKSGGNAGEFVSSKKAANTARVKQRVSNMKQAGKALLSMAGKSRSGGDTGKADQMLIRPTRTISRGTGMTKRTRISPKSRITRKKG